MCLLDAQLVFYIVGGVALGITGIRLYKDIIRRKKAKNNTEPELEKENFALEGN